MSKEAMTLALEAIEYRMCSGCVENIHCCLPKSRDAVKTLRQAIAEAEKQEPVAWIFKANRELLWPHEIERKNSLELNEYVPLYFNTHPNREWVGLTNEEFKDIWQDEETTFEALKKVEAKLKEKNT